MWRTQAGEILLAGLGAFAGLAIGDLLAAVTGLPGMLGPFGASHVLLGCSASRAASSPKNRNMLSGPIVNGHSIFPSHGHCIFLTWAI